jgi:hypothetical protein
MTWDKARDKFLKEIERKADPIMVRFKDDYAVLDRLIHQDRCVKMGYLEAQALAVQGLL